jgi:5-methylcytosine-specific restriction endonuclease McrA
MARKPARPNLGRIAEAAIALLRQHPEGLTMQEMRERIAPDEDQEHFNRRVREIRKLYYLDRKILDGRHIYVLGAEKEQEPSDLGAISERLRAEVIHAAHGRCQMCGKTISEDGIKLQADHKIPTSWGGPTELTNLWAICEACNRGKRNHFASFDATEMSEILSYKSVHERIARLLKMHLGEPVPSRMIEFVANATEVQDDWQKRLRELRYPPIGLKIKSGRRKVPEGYIESTYTLENWVELPPNHVYLIKKWERDNKAKKSGD